MSLSSAPSPRAVPHRFDAIGFTRRAARRQAVRRPAPALARPAAQIRDRRVLGIVAIVASTAVFPLSDLAAQSLMTALPPMEVAWLRYAVFVMAVLPLLARRGGGLRSARPGLQILRGAGAALATLAAIVSFQFLAVPTTTAISFVSPVMVTALAAAILGEAVGVRRWMAALVALAGVVVIVRPGGESFRIEALIPLAGAAAGAVAVVCTRANTGDGPGTTLLYSALTGLLMLAGPALMDWHTPTLPQFGVALVVGLFGALGSLLQVFAYRFAPASLLAPFTYTQLIWASGLSFLLLGTAPGGAMVAGGGLIAASAVYTGWRERVNGIA